MNLRDERLWVEVFSNARELNIPMYVIGRFSTDEARETVIRKLEAGEYVFQPPKKVLIPKDNGKMRTILVSNPEDRLLFHVIAKATYYEHSKTFSNRAKAYRMGVSVPKVVREVQTHLTEGKCIKIDLTKYFDTVKIRIIEKSIRELSIGDGVTQCLLRFYNDNRILDGEEYVEYYKSLCQGCAYSSVLANYILRDIDDMMSNLCHYYVRYSDDILVIDKNADTLIEQLRELLESLGLTINDKKTTSTEGYVDFLGAHITADKIGLSRNRKNKFKNNIKSVIKAKKTDGTRAYQIKAMRRLNRYLYGGDYPYMTSLCDLITDRKDIEWMNQICKSEIRAAYTGKHNHSTNVHKSSDVVLHKLGWSELTYMYNLYRNDRELFRAECVYQSCKVIQNYDFISVYEVLDYVQSNQVIPKVNIKSQCILIEGKWYKVYDPLNFEKIVTADLMFMRNHLTVRQNVFGISIREENCANDDILMNEEADSIYYSMLLMLALCKVDSDRLYVQKDGIRILTKLFNDSVVF